MSILSFILNRKKVSASNVLSFGKIVGYKNKVFSVSANENDKQSESHGLNNTPIIFGWAKQSGSSLWVPFWDFVESIDADSSVGNFSDYYISADSKNIYYRIVNETANTYSVEFRLWFVII